MFSFTKWDGLDVILSLSRISHFQLTCSATWMFCFRVLVNLPRLLSLNLHVAMLFHDITIPLQWIIHVSCVWSMKNLIPSSFLMECLKYFGHAETKMLQMQYLFVICTCSMFTLLIFLLVIHSFQLCLKVSILKLMKYNRENWYLLTNQNLDHA